MRGYSLKLFGTCYPRAVMGAAVFAAALAMVTGGGWAGVRTAAAETFRMTSLEWPPYSGAQLEGQGLSVRVARAAFEAMGHDLEVTFFPWQRAVQTGLGSGYVGYFPEYFDQDLADERCAFSEPMGSGPLGLVESTETPIEWQDLADLRGLTIGTVAGYVNTKAFDTAVAEGRLTVDPANDDMTNVRKVAAGRLDAAVIDANVLTWLLTWNSDLQSDVRMDDRLLEDKALFVCFQKTEVADRVRAIFNQGLDRIDIKALMRGE